MSDLQTQRTSRWCRWCRWVVLPTHKKTVQILNEYWYCMIFQHIKPKQTPKLSDIHLALLVNSGNQQELISKDLVTNLRRWKALMVTWTQRLLAHPYLHKQSVPSIDFSDMLTSHKLGLSVLPPKKGSTVTTSMAGSPLQMSFLRMGGEFLLDPIKVHATRHHKIISTGCKREVMWYAKPSRRLFEAL